MVSPRILVTGAGGFVGRHVVAALRTRGLDVVAFGRNAPVAAAGVPTRAFDLHEGAGRRRALAWAGADVLVHAAWTTAHGAFWSSPNNVEWVATSMRLAEEFADAGGSRVVLIGSCAEYDWSDPATNEPWHESLACRPHSLYGAAKLKAWTGIAEIARRRRMTAANARLFSPVGAGEHPARLVPTLIRRLLRGETLETGPGDRSLDLLDVRDAAEAIALVALDVGEGPMNVGSGQPLSVADIAGLVAASGDRPELLRVGALPARPGDPACMVADIGRLSRATGFRPRIGPAAMIATALAWWSEHPSPAA